MIAPEMGRPAAGGNPSFPRLVARPCPGCRTENKEDAMSDTTTKPVPETPEEKVDESVEETFPASDAPAIGGSTGPND
jgi:hypothetical protein